MSLTDFVKIKNVNDKFNSEFKPVLKEKGEIKYYWNSRKESNIRKENVGLYFEIFDGKVKLICDSFGRKKMVSSIQDLFGFFTYSKYRNNLCWFYDDSLNIEPILKYFPASQLKDLEKSGIIGYHAYTIEYEEKKNFRVKSNFGSHYFYFYNLFPFFNSNLDDSAIKYLNYKRTDIFDHDNVNDNINYWNNNYGRIVDNGIENAKIIQKLANYFVKNNADITLNSCNNCINPPQTRNYSTVGTAFDYLLRFLIKAHNPSAISSPWVACKSLNILKGREKKKALSIINDVEERYSQFLKKKEINDELIFSTLLLVKLDVVFRRGVKLEEIDMDVEPGDIVDLRNLINGVPKELYIAKNHCFLNPVFGLASSLVGGADADLFIDNTLIDIKTTNNSKFMREYFNQLMGYVILHELGQIYSNNIEKIDPKGIIKDLNGDDFDKAFLNTKIEKIGIYFSRFNYLHTIDLMDVLTEGKIDWQLLKWFEHEAHKEYKPMIMEIVKMKKFFR